MAIVVGPFGCAMGVRQDWRSVDIRCGDIHLLIPLGWWWRSWGWSLGDGCFHAVSSVCSERLSRRRAGWALQCSWANLAQPDVVVAWRPSWAARTAAGTSLARARRARLRLIRFGIAAS